MNFFINRPIFAMCIALVMILAGTICMIVLPVTQYPPLVPPQIQISTQYIGAGADVVSDTVTTPLEEQINGAAGMIYMSSSSTNNGESIITVTFDVGYDQDVAQMELLTRSNQALPGLPPEVNQVGLTIRKINNLPGLRRIFIRLQGARREHNGLCDQRATQKPDKKTIKMDKLFIADSLKPEILRPRSFTQQMIRNYSLPSLC